MCYHAINSLNMKIISWWRHQMETFSALLAICAWNSPFAGEFPAQRPVMRSFDVFFDLRLNKRLSKQSWGWWFEMPSCPLWRQSKVIYMTIFVVIILFLYVAYLWISRYVPEPHWNWYDAANTRPNSSPITVLLHEHHGNCNYQQLCSFLRTCSD